MNEEITPTPLTDGKYDSLALVVAENSVDPTEKDLERIEEMAAIGCSPFEICGVMKIPQENFKNSPEVRQACLRGQERAKMSLRRLQWKSAQKNPIMQIFLGKQLLGQSDKVEHKNDQRELDAARKELENKLKKLIDVTPKKSTDSKPKRPRKRSSAVPVGPVG
jgi:hypothetical protein